MTSSSRTSLPQAGPRLTLVGVVAAAILYGSLYPFAFYYSGSFAADVAHFLGTWRQPPQGRGDLLANLLLYAPLSLAIMLALEGTRPKAQACILAVLTGALLSLAIELVQFYDATRVSALSDFYLNTASSLAGALIALAGDWSLEKASWPHGSAPAFARLLLLAFLGWRLFPYAPTIDLHKYWHALRPVLMPQSLSVLDVFRTGVLWLSASFLLQTGFKTARPGWWLALVMVIVLAGKVVIVNQQVLPEELLGCLSALIADPLLRRLRTVGTALLAVLMLLVILQVRISPWQPAHSFRGFQWVPFFGFLHGSLQANLVSFFQKFYSYGTVILLLVASGMKLRPAVALTCVLLLATSLLQMAMVARSAEVTDALLALACGVIYALLRRQDSQTAPSSQAGAAS